MRAVFRALPNRAALLLVGDVDQLPSVGPGQVLADIIASDAVHGLLAGGPGPLRRSAGPITRARQSF